MPAWEELRGQAEWGYPITPEWGKEVINILQALWERGAVDYYGYVRADLVPDKDLILKLGLPDMRFLSLYAGYGYFTYDVYVAGKKVLKDEDPIQLADIWPEAQYKISRAIDYAYGTFYQKRCSELLEQLLRLGLPVAAPELLAIKVNYAAPDMAFIFSPHVAVKRTGRVRTKITSDADVVPYLYWQPKGFVDLILSSLNAGVAIPAFAWHEFDFTVQEGDYVNVAVSPGATVTIALFNIPQG